MTWLNFLHIYQPANAESYIIRKALDKSYWRLARLMEDNPTLRFTWNITGCLLERLAEEKEDEFLERLKFLVKKGRVELTGSAAFHGFLPLLPVAEIIRQIRANEKILKRFFGPGFKPAGFFFPEMAYHPEVARIVKRLGYQWMILDEIAYSGGGPERPVAGQIYTDEASSLKVVFRDRQFSASYPPDRLLAMFKEAAGKAARPSYLITATDGELYGLRHEDPSGELEKAVKIPGLKTQTVSSFIKRRQPAKRLKIKVWPSSWDSLPAEVRQGRPYRLWQDGANKIQTELWKLAALALSLEEKYKKDKNYYWYRWHLSRGLASCTFWWASARDFSRVYGPYAWSPDEVERGLEDLVRAVRSLEDAATKKEKLAAEKYYLKIKKLIWTNHWKKHWQKTI